MNLPARRKGKARRTRHPMPQPRQDGSIPECLDTGADVRRGPQHRLCQRTACCVCFALWWRRVNGERDCKGAVTRPDWTALPALHEHAPGNDSHHEPAGHAAGDDGTVPLCPSHHTTGFVARHTKGARWFWDYFRIDWTAVRDEMRRRTKSLVTVVVVKGEAERDSPVAVLATPPRAGAGAPARAASTRRARSC